MQKLVDRYWIFGLIVCMLCFFNVLYNTQAMLAFVVLGCIFFNSVHMRMWRNAKTRKDSWPSEIQMSGWKYIGFWMFLILFEILLILFSIQMVGLTFKSREAASVFPEIVTAILRPAAPVFAIIALLFSVAFMVLFCLKAIQLWKQMVENDKADREKNNNVPKQ